MAKVIFNVLVIYTAHGEVLETLVGTPITILNELKETTHFDSMMEEWIEDAFPESSHNNAQEFLENLSNYYEDVHPSESRIVVRIKYFPNKTYQYRSADL